MEPRPLRSVFRDRTSCYCSKTVDDRNVKTLQQFGKLQYLKNDMKRLHADVIDMAQMRWRGKACTRVDTTQLSTPVKTAAESGVGLILNECLSRTLIGRLAISDRVSEAKLTASPFDLLIILVYAPTAQSDNSVVQNFLWRNRKSYETGRKSRSLDCNGWF